MLDELLSFSRVGCRKQVGLAASSSCQSSDGLLAGVGQIVTLPGRHIAPIAAAHLACKRPRRS